jgi:molecular chaperone DnaJ
MSLDPYKTLGVDKTADAEAIKKAYRKLALQYHPDKNPGDKGAEEKFKDITTAYDILGNPEKKSAYDNSGGEEFFRRGADGQGYKPPDFSQGFPGVDEMEDFLSQIFGGFGAGGRSGASGFGGAGFGSSSRRRRASPPRKGADWTNTLNLDFMQAALGAKVKLQFDQPAPCQNCAGTGLVQQGGGMARCPVCRGTGEAPEKSVIEVTIPKGASDGQRLRLKGRGARGQGGGPAGDLILTLAVGPHKDFQRDKLNILSEAKVSLYTLLLGGKARIPTLTGPASIMVPKGSQNGKKLRLTGKGIAPEKGKPGDMIVTLRAVLPEGLSPEAEEAVMRLKDLAPAGGDDNAA